MFKKLLICSAALLYTTISSFAAPTPAPAPVRVSDQTAYQGVMKHLDQNGPLFLNYTSVNVLKDAVRELVQITMRQPKFNQDTDLNRMVDVFSEVWNDSGLDALQSSGTSVVRDGKYFVVRSFDYAPAPARNGFVWKLFPQSMTLQMAELMPANAGIALAVDFDGKVFWDTFNKYLRKYADAGDIKSFDDELAKAKKDGVDIPAFVSGISGIGGYFVFDMKALQNPDKGQTDPMEFALIISMKYPALFGQLLANAQKKDPKSVQNGTITVPFNGRKLVVFPYKNYIVAATNPTAFKARLEKGKASVLTANADFVAFTKGAPAGGIAWGYIAPGFVSRFVAMGAAMVQPTGIDLMAYANFFGIGKGTFVSSGLNGEGMYSFMRTGSRPVAVFCGCPQVFSALSGLVSSCMDGKGLCGLPFSGDDDADADEADDDDDDDDAEEVKDKKETKKEVKEVKEQKDKKN